MSVSDLRAMFAGLLVSALCAGCGSQVSGGGSESGGSAEGELSYASYCDARGAACGIDVDVCKAQEACAKGLLRDEIEQPLFSCLASTCDENVCFQATRASTSPTPSGAAFQAAWQGYINACPDGNDDVELAAWMVGDDKIGEFQACAETPGCAEAGGCFSQVHAAEVEVCNGWF